MPDVLRRHQALAGVLAVLALAACGSSADTGAAPSPAAASASPTTPSSSATPTATLPATGPTCPDEDDRRLSRTLGGAQITGLVRGTGRRVVILSRQSRGTVCDLATLAHVLAGSGFRVVAWDAGIRTGQDTLAALVADERRRGATWVALVGASAGGATSIGAAAVVSPPVDAVAALSPSGQSELFGDVVPAAGRYRGPLLVLTGELDSEFAGMVPDIAAAHLGYEDVEVLPGESAHGKSLVVEPESPITLRVVRFLSR